MKEDSGYLTSLCFLFLKKGGGDSGHEHVLLSLKCCLNENY